MIEYILLILLILAALFILFSLIGKSLRLFSDELLNRYMSSFVYRWTAYSVSGFTWFLGKIHFPITETAVTYGFDNKVGLVLRAAYWKSKIKEFGKDIQIDIGAKVTDWSQVSIGDKSWIDRNAILETGRVDNNRSVIYRKQENPLVMAGQLKIGKGCHISKNVVIQSRGGVLVGDYTTIASGAKIYSISHHYRNMQKEDDVIYKFSPFAPPEEQSLIQGTVVFEGNNALGLNSIILPGVTIGKNSWIGVCSYVISDIPPNCLALGCPAKVIKKIRG